MLTDVNTDLLVSLITFDSRLDAAVQDYLGRRGHRSALGLRLLITDLDRQEPVEGIAHTEAEKESDVDLSLVDWQTAVNDLVHQYGLTEQE